VEVEARAAAAGDAAAAGASVSRPAPHHQLRGAGWGRVVAATGEISLAHRGVLFLDELPEFGATKLEGLRQPLEDRTVTLARAAGTLSFPAIFTLPHPPALRAEDPTDPF
jgi:magnesium chelatase family protein